MSTRLPIFIRWISPRTGPRGSTSVALGEAGVGLCGREAPSRGGQETGREVRGGEVPEGANSTIGEATPEKFEDNAAPSDVFHTAEGSFSDSASPRLSPYE